MFIKSFWKRKIFKSFSQVRQRTFNEKQPPNVISSEGRNLFIGHSDPGLRGENSFSY